MTSSIRYRWAFSFSKLVSDAMGTSRLWKLYVIIHAFKLLACLNRWYLLCLPTQRFLYAQACKLKNEGYELFRAIFCMPKARVLRWSTATKFNEALNSRERGHVGMSAHNIYLVFFSSLLLIQLPTPIEPDARRFHCPSAFCNVSKYSSSVSAILFLLSATC